MASLIIGGVAIPVAVSSPRRDRLDMTDRARAFDGTYRASATGTPKREWTFSTPPVARAVADLYELTLGRVEAQGCSGDIIGDYSNPLLWSEDMTNAAWTKTNMTVTGVVVDPTGGNAGRTLTATAGNGTVSQNLSAGASLVRNNNVWLKRRSGVGAVEILDPGNNAYTAVTLTTDWQRFTVTIGGADVDRFFAIRIVTSGNEVDVFGAQMNDGATALPYVKTTSAAVTTPVSCCSEITGWTPVRLSTGHAVVLDFALHEV